jgi:hypothetical protein
LRRPLIRLKTQPGRCNKKKFDAAQELMSDEGKLGFQMNPIEDREVHSP